MTNEDQTELSEPRVFTHEQFMSALRLDILERLDSVGNVPDKDELDEFEIATEQLMRLMRHYREITKDSAHMYDLDLQRTTTVERTA